MSPTIHEVAGLGAPVEILTDRWGVPHIYAGGFDDVFLAQGFQAARDRLWQMDLWRKRGLGEMAKDFGPAYAESDRMARAVLFRGSMYHEWLAYGADAKRVAEAFVTGVNAYVELVEKEPARLPEEFRILGYKPAKWAPSDIVRIRHHGLTLNLASEVARAQAYCGGGERGEHIDGLRRELAPPIQPAVPEGLDPCAIPALQVMRAYNLATGAPRFTKRFSRPRTASARMKPLTTPRSTSTTSAATTGRSRLHARRPAARSSRAIPIAPTSRRTCATSATWWHPAWTSSARASRSSPGSRWATTVPSPSASRASTSTRRTSTSTS